MKKIFFSFLVLTMLCISCQLNQEIDPSIIGTFSSNYGDKYVLTSTTFEYSYNDTNYSTTLKGNNCYYDVLSKTDGIIYYQYTENSDFPELMGKWTATAYKNLSDKSVQFSNAYKNDNNYTTDTLEDAKHTLTLSNGFFSYFGEYARN